MQCSIECCMTCVYWLNQYCLYNNDLFFKKLNLKKSLQKYLNAPWWTSIFGKNLCFNHNWFIVLPDILVSKPMSMTMSMKDLMDVVITTLHFLPLPGWSSLQKGQNNCRYWPICHPFSWTSIFHPLGALLSNTHTSKGSISSVDLFSTSFLCFFLQIENVNKVLCQKFGGN